MGQVAVIAAVMFKRVALQLTAHRRGRAAETTGDLAHAQAVTAQGGDALAFEQREVAVGAGVLRQALRWQPAVLRPPPVAGLATDAQLLTRLDRANPGLDQPPVL
jgi:hypothetical protein